MYVNVKETAKLLSVSEKTVYRWIKRNLVPTYKVHGSYRFKRAELLDWATSKRRHVVEEPFEPSTHEKEPLPKLADSLSSGGIVYRIAGNSRDAVLADAVNHLRLPDEVDLEMLKKVMIIREDLASTGVGDGVALPHPRNAVLDHLTRAKVNICFLEQPVDYGALDNKPVHTLIIVVSPSLRVQLHLLSILHYILRDPDLKKVLAAQPGRDEVIAAILDAEKRIGAE
ncbi:MAG TPA: PTS sugar transporter subunit IIA [Pseudomonadales bacterium]|nr:PTS sugar transporter subunit IIA [Desulfuromonadaceae bacterium]HUH57534.1 PTS sugar transporter subunit IIA [Pseudomonadales bacterium]